MSLFCLGFGYDVDYSLLDTLAKQNDGIARRVYEASDAALQLQVFSQKKNAVIYSINIFNKCNLIQIASRSWIIFYV